MNINTDIKKLEEIMKSLGENSQKMVVGTKNAIEKFRELEKKSGEKFYLEEGYVLPNRLPADDDVVYIMPNLKRDFLIVKYEDDYERDK